MEPFPDRGRIVVADAPCHIAAMPRADLSSPRRTRLGAAMLVAGLHVMLLFALIRALAPDMTMQASERLTAVFIMDQPKPPREPPPAPEPRAPEPEGGAAPAGKRATPREVALPRPKIVLAPPSPAPPVEGKGAEDAAGARDAGAGTGAGGQGAGTGSGASGTGRGGGGAAHAVKIAGDINSARDYPAQSRELRIGDHVILALSVGVDGRVRNCRVHRASRDPEADRITCRLAVERFRFRPATDAAGRPVESIYGWRQQWYDPRGKE